MTDGPFKNLKLGNCWRRLVEAIENDAASPAECGAIALDAFTQHLVTREHVKLLEELDAYLNLAQLELDPFRSVEAIFDGCEKTPFLDTLQKELLFRIASGVPPCGARESALDAAIDIHVGEARSRFQEECIRAQKAGEMSQSESGLAWGKIDSAFDAVKSAQVRDALLAGNKEAFSSGLGKCDGVDEGMVVL